MARVILSVVLHYKSITFGQIGMTECRAMSQAVSSRQIIADARVQCQASPCEIRGGQSGTGAGFSPTTARFVRFYSRINLLHSLSN
jgi:hypothetical protein